GEGDAARRLRGDLAERERERARRVAEHSRGAEGRWRWVETADVQRRLPPDTILVEIARFAVNDLAPAARDRPWRPARYAAWVIGRDDVQVVDLGEALPIERAVAACRAALAEAPRTLKAVGEPEGERLLRAHLRQLSDRV